MEEACVHKRSRRGLLGDSKTRNKHLRNLLSLEKHVPIDCPPVFLVNCKDDPIVDYRNSVLLDSALTSKGICHEYIQYKTGGHGFGVSDHKGSVESREWKNKFVEWLNKLLK
jgi:acetyl esterase/lipase